MEKVGFSKGISKSQPLGHATLDYIYIRKTWNISKSILLIQKYIEPPWIRRILTYGKTDSYQRLLHQYQRNDNDYAEFLKAFYGMSLAVKGHSSHDQLEIHLQYYIEHVRSPIQWPRPLGSC